jgi:hypothetical protein
MPFGYGVGDHCACILDIPIESIVGMNPVKIVGRQVDGSIADYQDAARHTSPV